MTAMPGLAIAKVEHLIADWCAEDGMPFHRAFHTDYELVRPLPSVPHAYRIAAVVHPAVDSVGRAVHPDYPEQIDTAAIDFHRAQLDT